MSKPKRKTKELTKTKLMICEGISDKAFMERIKAVYHPRNCGFSIRLDEASGGGPKTAILAAINYYGSFDKKYVYIDSDLPIPRDALAAANSRGIVILQSIPWCLEGMLLKMTGHNGEIRSSQHAKDLLYGQYNLPNVVTHAWYEQNISEEVINKIISTNHHFCCKPLTELIDVFKMF